MQHSPRLRPLIVAAMFMTSGCTGPGLAELAPVLAAAGQRDSGDRPGTETPASPAFAAFEQRVAAATGDPRLTAKLFLEAMIRHAKDADLSRAMASLLVVDEDLRDDAQSPSGRDFTPHRRVLFDQLAPRAYLLREYLDQPAVIDEADLTGHIVIDEDDKAVGQGLDEAAGSAKFYVQVFNDKGTRPRPIALERRGGAWKVVEYASLFVGT